MIGVRRGAARRIERRLGIACALAALLAAGPAHAQSPGVTEKLIDLLVKNGVLKKEQAAALLSEAQAEARAGKPAARAKSAAAPAEPEAPPGSIRVTYVPEIVRKQIAEEVRGDVMQQARAEGWAQPNSLPDWISRIKLYGDMRLRDQEDMFPKGNYADFTNYNAINAAGGFNVNNNATGGATFPPLLDSTEDRERFRVRFRVGLLAQVDDQVVAQFAVGTGNDNSPVSFYDTFGSSGGNFSKPALYLDKGNLQVTPYPWLKLVGGRADNPFWTTDLQFYTDLNFDGFSVSATPQVANGLSLFATAGAFPVFNSTFSLSTADTGAQVASRDKWLFAAQGGAQWRISDDYAAKVGVGYFDYSNIQGKFSSPCLILVASDTCSSDISAANFLQQGNTVFGIRNFVTNAQNQTVAEPQLYGLASKFGILDVRGQFTIDAFRPVSVSVDGDFVKNLSFSKSDALAHSPINNFGASVKLPSGALVNGPYDGGDVGYLARVTVGKPTIAKLWDWNAFVTYKYVQSDAVLDAVNDPDFHLGGTNAEGYIVGASLGVARNTYLVLRYLSSSAITGPKYDIDTLQIDLNARF